MHRSLLVDEQSHGFFTLGHRKVAVFGPYGLVICKATGVLAVKFSVLTTKRMSRQYTPSIVKSWNETCRNRQTESKLCKISVVEHIK